eukprot:SAG31_NODE_1601_length_7786_cov_33.553272_12_plen_171_part_00
MCDGDGADGRPRLIPPVTAPPCPSEGQGGTGAAADVGQAHPEMLAAPLVARLSKKIIAGENVEKMRKKSREGAEKVRPRGWDRAERVLRGAAVLSRCSAGAEKVQRCSAGAQQEPRRCSGAQQVLSRCREGAAVLSGAQQVLSGCREGEAVLTRCSAGAQQVPRRCREVA